MDMITLLLGLEFLHIILFLGHFHKFITLNDLSWRFTNHGTEVDLSNINNNETSNVEKPNPEKIQTRQ